MRVFAWAASLLVMALVPGVADAAPSDRAVLAAINHARMYPRDLADELRDYRDAFDGSVGPDGVMTREGVAAVDEAIAFLDRQKPLPPLAWGEVLAAAAQDHADDEGRSGMVGHVSRDGASPGERVRRHGGDIYVSEAISYGQDDAAGVVRQLIIDDGERHRGHRAIVFQANARFAGVGCAEHLRYREMCVVDLAQSSDGRPAIAATLSRDDLPPSASDMRP
jgi:uncharacterized protein YkwD